MLYDFESPNLPPFAEMIDNLLKSQLALTFAKREGIFLKRGFFNVLVYDSWSDQ